MAFDGVFLHLLIKELDKIKDSKIDKIHQPSRDELVFLLRKSGFSGRLFISLKSGRARLHLTEERPENPDKPPMFCMLLRKHLTGAKITGITQENFDRVATIHLSALNELGDLVNFRLVCELISNQANLILVDENGKIVDALRRSDIESAKRIIHPGANYTLPEKQNKFSLINDDLNLVFENIFSLSGYTVLKAFMETVDGISPLIAREICHKTKTNDLNVGELNNQQKDDLKKAILDLREVVLNGGNPTIIFKGNSPFDFSYTPIFQYGEQTKNENLFSFCSLLDCFYSTLDRVDRIKNSCADISRLLKNARERTAKKLQIRSADLKKTEEREQLRVFGELIKANLHVIKTGMNSVTVQNYYADDLSLITIPLNPALSPAQNAAKYFKDYKRANTARQLLASLIEQDSKELLYIDSVSEALSRAENTADVNEIKEELISSGYLRANKNNKKATVSNKFIEFESKEGYKILVGKNNRQNDLLTTKIAQKNDIWLHTKNIPGSHVIIFCDGNEVSDETLIFAAKLAAKNSKAKDGASVPVDYTPVKFVKKPAGAKPGMVIYTTNKTVYVTPEV